MKYVSMFSGIEAATVAWKPLDWQPVAFSEIEPFPCAVLKHHYPTVPNLGDITKVDWNDYHHTADIVVGGSPCQSFSIAGFRKALDDPRGQLMPAYFRACQQIDPEWIVWENVPGVLSADHGRAFGTLLQIVAELWPDGGAAWRVLDAQFYGVAQRRRRVFVVINTRDWRRAAPVLFERESLRWDYPTSKAKRQALTGSIVSGVAGADTGMGAGNCLNHSTAVLCKAGDSANAEVGYDVSPTVCNRWYKGAGFVSPAHTLLIRGGKPGGGKGALVSENLSQCLTSSNPQTIFTGQLACKTVRRLTPRECERLQGFPDDYTNVAFNGKPASDANRYRALGNSMAVPVMRWIGEGINIVEQAKHEGTL